MIERIPGTKNGYKLANGATNEEFQNILHNHPQVRSIIVNSDTLRHFQHPSVIPRKNIMTVNNRVKHMEFYVNAVR